MQYAIWNILCMGINLFSFFFSLSSVYTFSSSIFFTFLHSLIPYYLPFSQIKHNNFPYFSSHTPFSTIHNVCIYARKSFTIYLINFIRWRGGGLNGNVEMPTNQRSPHSYHPPSSSPAQLLKMHNKTFSTLVLWMNRF